MRHRPKRLLSVSNQAYYTSKNHRIYSTLYELKDPNDERKVIVKKLALVVEGRDDMELDLSGDISQLKKQVSLKMLSHILLN